MRGSFSIGLALAAVFGGARRARIAWAVAALLVAAGARAGALSPTPSPSPSPTATQSPSASPSPSPSPTASPSPTVSPTPTASPTPVAGAIYVAPEGSDATGDGSRGNPYGTIQFGIDMASDGMEVILLPGTYTGSGNRSISFRGKAIAVRGEAGSLHTIIDGMSVSTFPFGGFIFRNGERRDSILEGVTIQRFDYSDFFLFDNAGGAGVATFDASPTIRDCDIRYNRAYGVGGPFGGSGRGGGVFVMGGEPLFERCHIYGNSTYASTSCDRFCCGRTPGSGAGAYISSGSPLFESCQVHDNVAVSGFGCYSTLLPSRGGGIYIAVGAALFLRGCTVAGNDASEGAGIWGIAILQNTILSGNIGGDLFDAPESLGHNIVGDVSFALDGPGDLNATDPMLELVEGIYVPLPGSPAIDSGDDTFAPATDVRGLPRRCDGDGDGVARVDRGAVEVQGELCRATRREVVDVLLGRPPLSGQSLDLSGDGAVDSADVPQ